MPTHISLLRGINVSGHNLIKMAELREAAERAGFERVQTYIQSGNLVLHSTMRSAAQVSKLLVETIRSEFGLEVPVVTRSVGEWRKIHERDPLDLPKGVDESKSFVTFLSGKLKKAGLAKLEERKARGDLLRLDGSELYFYLPGGAAKSKLDNGSIERHLGVSATTRNRRTIAKLMAMAEGS